ncbi:MAG: hypothetical protein HZA54_18255 [Planctomycetes bacterium]|nr:hypothetical protein [Planctomycetota bacterium]
MPCSARSRRRLGGGALLCVGALLAVLAVRLVAAEEPALGDEVRDRATSLAFRPPAGWTKMTSPPEGMGGVQVAFADPNDAATCLALIRVPEPIPGDLKSIAADYKKAVEAAGGIVGSEDALKVARCPSWRTIFSQEIGSEKFVNYAVLIECHESSHPVLFLRVPRARAAAVFPVFEKVLAAVRMRVVAFAPAELEAIERFRKLAARTSGHWNRALVGEQSMGIFRESTKVGFATWKVEAGKVEDKDVYLLEGRQRIKIEKVLLDESWKVGITVDLTQQTFEQKVRKSDGTVDATVESSGVVRNSTSRRKVKCRGQAFEGSAPVPPLALLDSLFWFAATLAGPTWEDGLAVPLISPGAEVDLLRFSKGMSESGGPRLIEVEAHGARYVLGFDPDNKLVLQKGSVLGGLALEWRAMPKEEAEK